MHKLLVAFTLGIASFSTVQAQSNSELLVSLNSGIPQTQGVAMVLRAGPGNSDRLISDSLAQPTAA
ncbi:MAG: hypothetical protein E6Q42_14410 [Dechloromonas sp.]|nr:MAG: hypothetical protein E6Q42_14410 [Dechloromonas sp.]